MGKTYVHINSADRKPHETSSKMTVHLSDPIQKAVSVKMVSFTTPNEFFNIIKGNNIFQIKIQDFSDATVAEEVFPIDLDFVLPPGIYTTSEIVDRINSALLDVSDEERGFLDIVLELSTVTHRVTVTATPMIDGDGNSLQSPNTVQRVYVYYPHDHDSGFRTSIIHRLGFSRFQVSPHLTPFIIKQIDPELELYAIDFYGKQVVSEFDVDYQTINPLVYTNVTGDNVGWETHPFIFVQSDELVKHAVRTHSNNRDGSVGSFHTNMLQKIPINVNLYSWVHYTGTEYTYEHQLDGRTIHDFDISLADFEHQLFPNKHFKHFSMTLEFETLDNATDINRAAISALSKKGYAIRHGCS